MKVVMIVCAKCGFQNDANTQKCTNCLIDLHWARVNLGEFQGSEEDTRRIGIEARKARGILVPENGSLPLEPIQIEENNELPLTTGAKVGVVIASTIIGAFFAIVGAVLKIRFGLYGVGLPTWLGVAFLCTPGSGAVFAFVSSLITLRQTESKLIIISVSAAVGLFSGFLLFDYSG
jgi:hypothetical protein